jgi:hypothetical protein
LLLIVANIATAVVLYPIVKRQTKILALGSVADVLDAQLGQSVAIPLIAPAS